MKELVENASFFFIIGRPRSGTTLLQTLFDAHPNILVPPEYPAVFWLYKKYGQQKNWNENLLNEFFEDAIRVNWKFDAWNCNLEKLHIEILNAGDHTDFNTLIKILYLNYQSPYKKEDIRVIGDKNPMYSLLPEMLMTKISPDSKVIHLIRDFRDHIVSVRKTGLLNGSLPLAAKLWRDSARKMHKLKKKFPQRIMVIRYEDLVSEPAGYMEKLSAFLDVPYSDEMLKFHEKGDSNMQAYSREQVEKFQPDLMKPVDPGRKDNWKSKLTDQEVQMAEYIAGKYASLFNYERKFGSIPFAVKRKAIFRIMIISLYRIFKSIMNRFSQSLGMGVSKKLPDIHTFYSRFFGSN